MWLYHRALVENQERADEHHRDIFKYQGTLSARGLEGVKCCATESNGELSSARGKNPDQVLVPDKLKVLYDYG